MVQHDNNKDILIYGGLLFELDKLYILFGLREERREEGKRGSG